MKKNTVVCPHCGSKDISKNVKGHQFKGYYGCRKCKEITKLSPISTSLAY